MTEQNEAQRLEEAVNRVESVLQHLAGDANEPYFKILVDVAKQYLTKLVEKDSYIQGQNDALAELRKENEFLKSQLKEALSMQRDNLAHYLDQENMLIRQNKELHSIIQRIRAIGVEEIWTIVAKGLENKNLVGGKKREEVAQDLAQAIHALYNQKES